MIKRREKGQEKTYAFFGTGNFNEKTAGMYSDMGLFTANKDLCAELESVFEYLYKRKQPAAFQHLLVSQFGSLAKFIALIDREIEHASQGKASGITIKVNNLEEETLINKLYEASRAGVPVKLCVRSICRVKPGVKGMSENIQLIRVVGRYLEHSRVFVFHNEGNNDVYLGSADWMKRNLHSRVEVVFPVYDSSLKRQVLDFVAIQFSPADKTQLLSPELETLQCRVVHSSTVRRKLFIITCGKMMLLLISAVCYAAAYLTKTKYYPDWDMLYFRFHLRQNETRSN